MNTSKQVNVMIGLLFLSFLVFGAYIINEPNRAARAEDAQAELLAERGAELFVSNCRTCHGMIGLGPDEGAIAPRLNSAAFLILGEDNAYDMPETPEGEARAIREFLFSTIACGRQGTAMPVWGEEHGGPLSDMQINYLVDMITTGRWDLVEEIGHEHDAETGDTPEDIVFQDASTLALTGENCGQYTGVTALPFRTRPDPRQPAAPTQEPGATPGPDAGPADAVVQGLPVGEFFQASCSSCHGADRAGVPGLGLPLTPDALTQPDEFYFDTIANGRAGTVMPSWSAAGLTDDEINALVQFIKNVEP